MMMFCDVSPGCGVPKNITSYDQIILNELVLCVFSSEFKSNPGFFTSPIPKSSKLFSSIIGRNQRDIFA